MADLISPNDDDPMLRVVGRDVHAAAVAVFVEADLRVYDPAQRRKQLRGGLLHSGMRRIDEPIELFAAPSDLHLK